MLKSRRRAWKANLDGAMAHVRNLEGLAKTCDEEAKRISERGKSFTTQSKSIRGYILQCF